MHSDKRSKVILARGTKGKAAVFGVLERGGKVRAESLHGRKRHELETKVRAHIKAGSAIYSDNFASYDRLNNFGYKHAVVDHAERYVDGQVHTNGLENFWSLLKRGLKGTYVNVEPFHLFRYLDEQVFRYNNRAKKDHFIGDGDRFQMAMRHIAGRRVTYQELTGKGTDSLHHEEAGTRPS
jgi:transposase-like protein